ncbi:MAG TPA: hypothetical protein PKO41_10910 [Dokdonella sp.]|uniref:hypothetical protein n=1 Tax=Dokdonella sp. TaxID=2291710 RepID=UPI0025C27A0E|nr:hypothetical protein [Dokdonella sp.]MBX3692543.1 hypothetical protein [Dokdonella sp.]MCW5567419.1 hypothetical protein [Dokdonella sp.]HNR92917.1 hypothetical protein [Dokdonella sp.]
MKSLPLLLLLCTGTIAAQDKNMFTLNDGSVHFSVPSAWTAIMEKSDGNPQAIVFQVHDPAAQGTDDAATITVKTRQLKSPADYPEAVQNEILLSKSQAGYEVQPGSDGSGNHRYYVLRGKTRYEVRDRFVLIGTIAAQVRCQRPLLDATSRDWAAAWDSGCSSVTASVH